MMPTDSSSQALFPQWLDANRSGALTDDQRRNLGNLSRSNRKSSLSFAAVLTVIGVLVLSAGSSKASPAARMGIGFGALAIAVFLVARAAAGADALSRDLDAARVDSVQGAIGKRRSGGGGSQSTTYFLDVGDANFSVSRKTYEAAPDAGFVRLYFLPQSRKVVNFEALPDASPAKDLSIRGMAESLGAVFGAHSLREANEARAAIAHTAETMRASFTESPNDMSSQPSDPRHLREAIVGTWKNAIMTVTFSPDGSVAAKTFAGERRGQWSIDSTGRLSSDITGRSQTADAHIAGNQLTISLDGQGLKLTRA